MTMVSVLLAAAACLVVGAPHSPTLAKGCAPPRTFEGFCTQVVVWAKNWRTGACCRYPNPCSVPKGYQIYDRPGCGKRASSAPRAALSRAENHGQLISLVPVWFAPLAEKAQQHACDDAPTAPRSPGLATARGLSDTARAWILWDGSSERSHKRRLRAKLRASFSSLSRAAKPSPPRPPCAVQSSRQRRR
jgi:hypothetical protein